MNKLKKLAGETAIYGISTILVRLLNWIINPFHTFIFATNKDKLGVIIEIYAYVAFLNVILMYGMETAFFRYATKHKDQKNTVFSTAFISLAITTLIFIFAIVLNAQNIANILGYPDLSNVIIMLAFIMGFDTLSNIPFAKLRLEGKSIQYVRIKLLNVVVTVLFNFLLLFPLYIGNNNLFGYTVSMEFGIFYVFAANLIASLSVFLTFIPNLIQQKWEFSKTIWQQLMRYGLPLIIVGLAGIVNETIDRILLKYLLPQETLEERNAQVAIYGSVYKLSIFMSLAVQAYRMGAEPFFFKQAEDKDAMQTVAKAMNVFVILSVVIFLGVFANLDWLILVVEESFHVAKNIVPILLFAYLFLGIFYNLSVWYKLTNKTLYAGLISICGAIVTISINVIFIPKYGYWASAWATLAAYFVMTIISWLWGKKHYPVPYQLGKIVAYLFVAIILFGLCFINPIKNSLIRILTNNLSWILFLAISYHFDLKALLSNRN